MAAGYCRVRSCSYFFKCYQNLKWPPEVNFIIFVGAKTLKLSQKLLQFYNHIPHDMESASKFFTEIQNGRHGSTS